MPHGVLWKNKKFSLTEKKFRQINHLVISLVKPLLSRNVCEKSVREFLHFPHSVPHETVCMDIAHFSLTIGDPL